ncbi:Arc family DNA-binding protein [Streptomyces sp. NPDC059718]
MPDVNVRIPAETRDRLAETAAAEGLSLRAYLARLADSLPTPAERAVRAEQACAILNEWNGYAPTPAEQDGLDAELDRRLPRATTSP